MSGRRLVGTIDKREGAFGLLYRNVLFYPIEGASGIASDFRDTFGAAGDHDIGKQVFYVDDVMQMENIEQRAERLGQ